jgi:hypothetical protein
LWIDPEKLTSSQHLDAPSLDEFRFERDPDGFYQESELIELYLAEYGDGLGNDRVRARNERIRRRQSEILTWLDKQSPRPPSLDDKISAWLDAKVAAKFELRGHQSLQDLITLISALGRGWWRTIPGIGLTRAREIEAWLTKFKIDSKVALAPIPLTQTRILRTSGIAPLDYFMPPSGLEGDFARVLDGLTQLRESAKPSTWRVYRREVERFMLFYALERPGCRPIVSDHQSVLRDYLIFLAELGRTTVDDWSFSKAQQEWIGPRHSERTTMAWRPFAGALLPSSIRLAKDTVNAFFNQLRSRAVV